METITPSGAPKGAVLVIHSWWGLTESFRKHGSILSDAGYLVGLADLFDGRTAETEAEARALRARHRRTPMYKTLGADISSLRVAVRSNKARIGVVGFSMGGHWAVWLSQRPEYNVAGTVLYYAARAGDFSNCRSGIMAHFADHDPWVNASARRNMERAIRKSGCEYRAYDYPETQHWFAESARPAEFDERAAHLALDRDLGHLERNLIL
ncbi:MAG: dienelactone hydrolase family protein [Paracoccaceae bacterium]